MGDGHEIKTLGNQQLGLHYEVTHQKFNDVQIAIVDDITDLLGNAPAIDYDTYTNAEKFHAYCEKYRPSIEGQKKELFLILMKQQKDIQEEIKERQVKMLKEIGIIAPSTWVFMIMEEMRGTNFQGFDEMIRYIKLAKKGQADKRPKGRIIQAPAKLIEKFERIGMTILTVLEKNTGPIAN